MMSVEIVMPGNGLADPRQPLLVVLDRVLATHPAQDRVRARLDRQVEVLADAVAVGERRDEPVREVPRVRGDEPEPPDRGPPVGGPQRVDGTDELGEVRATREVEPPAGPARLADVREPRLGREVVAVRVDVLAEQRHLAIAGGGQRPGLVDDVVERPAPLRAAAERHDAVGARLVAAVDDRQPGGDRGPARDGPLPDRPGPGRGQAVGDADDRTPDRRRGTDRAERADRRLRGRETEPVDELGFLVGAQEQVDRGVAAAQAGPIGLAHGAAGQDDAHRRIGRLEPAELAHPADDLLLGALADRAGVDDDEVGALERLRLLAAGRQQPPRHLLGVAPVHLAAERPDVEARQAARLGQVLGEPVVAGRRGSAWLDGRRRDEVEHRQGAGLGRRRSIGHGCAGEPTTAAPRTPAAASPAATSGGTHSPACASAYVPVSPW